MKTKRTWIFIVIGIVVLALVAGAAVLLLSEEQPEEKDAAISVSKIDYQKVTAMKITGENTGVVDVVKNDGVWSYRDDPSSEVDQMTMESALTMVCYLYAQEKLFDSVDDLSVYGLDPAKLKIVIELDDGTSQSFSFGIHTSARDGVFMCSDASSAIYLYDLDSYSILEKAALGIKDLSIDIDGSNLTKIEIMRTSGQRIPVTFEMIPENERVGLETWKVTSPFTAVANGEAVSLVQSFFALPRFSAFAGETVKSEYGFDESSAYIYLEDAMGKSVKLNVGKRNESGRYYCIEEGRDGVWLLAAGFESLFEIKTENIIPQAVLPISKDVNFCVKVDVTNNIYIIERGLFNNYTLNNEGISPESYNAITEALTGLSYAGVADNADISKEPYAVITIYMDEKEIEFAFYEYRNEFYAVGQYDSKNASGYVTKEAFGGMLDVIAQKAS